MLNIPSFTPSITEFIQGSSDYLPTFIEINIRRNRYFGPLVIIIRILESGIIFKLPVII